MNVRFTPKSGQSALQQLGSLLDHLVGERQKIHRQLDTRGLCGSTAGVCAWVAKRRGHFANPL